MYAIELLLVIKERAHRPWYYFPHSPFSILQNENFLFFLFCLCLQTTPNRHQSNGPRENFVPTYDDDPKRLYFNKWLIFFLLFVDNELQFTNTAQFRLFIIWVCLRGLIYYTVYIIHWTPIRLGFKSSSCVFFLLSLLDSSFI